MKKSFMYCDALAVQCVMRNLSFKQCNISNKKIFLCDKLHCTNLKKKICNIVCLPKSQRIPPHIKQYQFFYCDTHEN